MQRYSANFKEILDGFDFNTLDESPDTIFALSEDLKFIYFNKAWFEFAESNDLNFANRNKIYLETLFEESIGGDIKAFYIQKYQKALWSNKVWQHDYECSSPTNYRLFRQTVYPLKNGKGLICVNSLKIEQNINELRAKTENPDRANYLFVNGFIYQCSNCRRTQRATDNSQWDWIPEWVETYLKEISHTICPICFDYYWKNNK